VIAARAGQVPHAAAWMSSTSPFIWDRPRFIDRFRNLPAAPIDHLQMATGEVCELADADLVQRALGGKRDAFEAIYCRYQAIVYRFARSMTGSVAMAEDVTQEVFVTLIPRSRAVRATACGALDLPVWSRPQHCPDASSTRAAVSQH
jgi:Sigma-70 region 2